MAACYICTRHETRTGTCDSCKVALGPGGLLTEASRARAQEALQRLMQGSSGPFWRALTYQRGGRILMMRALALASDFDLGPRKERPRTWWDVIDQAIFDTVDPAAELSDAEIERLLGGTYT